MTSALFLDKRLAVDALADLRVGLMGSDPDLAEGAVVLARAVVGALLDGAFDRRVGSLVFHFDYHAFRTNLQFCGGFESRLVRLSKFTTPCRESLKTVWSENLFSDFPLLTMLFAVLAA